MLGAQIQEQVEGLDKSRTTLTLDRKKNPKLISLVATLPWTLQGAMVSKLGAEVEVAGEGVCDGVQGEGGPIGKP